jgi:hypothetical protein
MIDYDLLKNIEQYAKNHLESSRNFLVKKRNASEKNILDNILSGKIAEYNLYFHLLERNYILNEPDLKIYNKGKSYDSDLIILGKNNKFYETPSNLHIKAISAFSLKQYGNSFLVQKNNPHVINHKKLKNDWYVTLQQKSFLVYDNVKFLNLPNAEYQEIKQFPSKWKVTIL